MNCSHMMRLNVVLAALCTLLLSGSLDIEAQQPQVRTELDSVAIWVGGQVGLNVDVSVAKGERVDVLQLPDSLGSSVEVVSALRQDTLTEGDIVHFRRRYILTSFDSGLHYVAPIPIVRCDDGAEISTQEFALNVLNPFQDIKMDDESGVALITDIHNAEDAPFKWRELLEYWPWLVGALVFAGIVALGIWLYLKYGRRESGVVVKKQPDEPCEVIALRDLERIKDEKLWMHNRVKDYYSDLTDTLRRYISARYGVNAMESTTAQIMDDMSVHKEECRQEISDLEDILNQADFVKFAKHDPMPDENDMAMRKAVNFVTSTTEIALRLEEERKAKEAASKQNSEAAITDNN